MGKLRGELKVKLSGNKMMNALMRGLKQKLEEEMARNREIIDGQQTRSTLLKRSSLHFTV